MSDDKMARRKKQKIFFRNEDVDFNFLWALAYASCAGTEVGECFEAASRIRENDPESWANAWSELASELETRADGRKARRHTVSAKNEYLRAFTYHKIASMGLRYNDPRFRREWSRARSCFQDATSLMSKPVEAIEISYHGGILPGYFMRGSGDMVGPTLIVLIGGEGWAEDGYFFIGRAGLARGYNVLAVELQINPGTRILNDKLLDRDIEATLEAIVDYALSRPEVDKERLAIIGFSAGGYFALKAASIDPRIKACIADSPIHDLYGLFASEMPGPLVNAPAFIANSLVKVSAFNSPMSVIDLEKVCWVVGVNSIHEFMGACRALGTVDTGKIQCPLLCLAGEGESPGFLKQAREVYDTTRSSQKLLHIFTMAEGADAHCQLNNLSLMHEVAYDWLDEIFPGFDSTNGESTSGCVLTGKKDRNPSHR
ncbi:MAG TPA: alpha/beta hydrolase [Methanocella sp.]|nr:alpha/beta hydrolase [Methanocella sp.]